MVVSWLETWLLFGVGGCCFVVLDVLSATFTVLEDNLEVVVGGGGGGGCGVGLVVVVTLGTLCGVGGGVCWGFSGAGSWIDDGGSILLLLLDVGSGPWALGLSLSFHSGTLFRVPFSTLSITSLVHSRFGLFCPGWTDLAASPPLTDTTGTLGAPHSMHLLRFVGPGVCLAIITDSLATLYSALGSTFWIRDRMLGRSPPCSSMAWITRGLDTTPSSRSLACSPWRCLADLDPSPLYVVFSPKSRHCRHCKV